MVSSVKLAQIHLRLNEIFAVSRNSKSTFGNINIVLFGDLLQVIINQYKNHIS
jgi:hypothetical protein